jgi:hypothetical protein
MKSHKNIKLFRSCCNRVEVHVLLALITLPLLTGCPIEKTTTETVVIDEIFWEAFRDPVGFDMYLDAQTLDPRTSSCFRQFRDSALANEQSKLLECGVILEGSPAWNECHDEADAFRNNAVIMNDIANAIDGPGNFDETEAYIFLVITKSSFTEEDWSEFADALQAATPTYYCEYEGEKKWIWE